MDAIRKVIAEMREKAKVPYGAAAADGIELTNWADTIEAQLKDNSATGVELAERASVWAVYATEEPATVGEIRSALRVLFGEAVMAVLHRKHERREG